MVSTLVAVDLTSPATQVASAKAMNFLEVYYITRDELMSLAERYPATYAKIRRFAVFMALKREIIRLATAKLEQDGLHSMSEVRREGQWGSAARGAAGGGR